MTYRQYLETCDDEFERVVIIANLARKHPNYDSYSPRRKSEVLRELLDAEMPMPKRRKGTPLEENDGGYNCENWVP